MDQGITHYQNEEVELRIAYYVRHNEFIHVVNVKDTANNKDLTTVQIKSYKHLIERQVEAHTNKKGLKLVI